MFPDSLRLAILGAVARYSRRRIAALLRIRRHVRADRMGEWRELLRKAENMATYATLCAESEWS